jgi:hypothetical protein
MSDWSFVTAAYALTWAVLVAYALYTGRRVRAARAAFERASTGAAGEA